MFPKIDMRLGYYQLRIRSGDVSKTTFLGEVGHYDLW